MDEGFLSRLLPFISSGLEKSSSRDYQAATMIMVAELCSRSTLGKDFVKGEQEGLSAQGGHVPYILASRV